MTFARRRWRLGALLALAAGALVVMTAQTSGPMMGIVGSAQALTNLPPGQYQSVVRLGLNAPGDSPQLNYSWSGVPCAAADGTAWVSPASDATAGCWNAVFPASGVDVRMYGVSQALSAPQNAALLKQAAAAAYWNGHLLNICAGNGVVISTTGSPVYTSVRGCLGTTYQLKAPVDPAAAIFWTMPSPTANCPGRPVPADYTIAYLNLDLNSLDAAGLRVEGPWNTTIDHLYTANVATGSYSYSDCAATVSYPDAALVVKGNQAGGGGTFYTRIVSPYFKQPASASPGGLGATGGVGLWVGTTGTGVTSRPNTLEIRNGKIAGFAVGIDAFAVGDLTIDNVDLSGNTIGARFGGAGGVGSAPRPRIIKPYMENSAIGLYFTAGVTGDPYIGAVSSVSGNAAPIVSDMGTMIGVDSVANESPPSVVTASGTFFRQPRDGGFIVEAVGGGGAGGGARGSTSATNASLGGGGSSGAYIRAWCWDPLGFNFGGAQVTIGQPGTPGTGGTAATASSDTTIASGGSISTDWQPATTYRPAPNGPSYVLPSVGNAGGYLYAAAQSGASGASAPTWPQTIGNQVSDGSGGLIWINIGKPDWTANSPVVVNGAPTASSGVPVESVILPSSGNPGNYLYRAIHGGTTGSAPPVWNQVVLSLTQESATEVWWQNIGPLESIVAKAGSPGQIGNNLGVTTTAAGGVGPQLGTTANGCMILAVGGAASGSQLLFNGAGIAGAGGSNPLGAGGSGAAWVSSTTKQVSGNGGTGYGAGGSGAISGSSATGTDQTGGFGTAGAVLLIPRSKSIPW